MPVIINVVTGLLGSGKTSLLKHLILDPMRSERPAVVVGEFAEEGVDKTLLEEVGSDIPIEQLTASGIGEGAKSYLQPLVELVRSQKHNRVYLETSGVSEIHSVVGDLLEDPYLNQHTVFGPTTTVIDAGGFEAHHAHFGEQFWAQVEAADIVVVNKVDRASKAEVKSIVDRVKTRNPAAQVITAYMGQIRRGIINSPVDDDFAARILTAVAEGKAPSEFESFVFRDDRLCFDRVMFGHLLLNLPGARIARFKGRLKSWDKTHCVNGFPGQLDWDNTPVEGDTSIVFIGLGLLERQEEIVRLLDDELARQQIDVR